MSVSLHSKVYGEEFLNQRNNDAARPSRAAEETLNIGSVLNSSIVVYLCTFMQLACIRIR